MAAQDQKLRTLYIMNILMERTDEEHILNAADIMQILKSEYDIESDRKTIYGAVDTLKLYGLDIIQVKGKASGYYIGSRSFELPELKLLVDSVQSSKFITSKKSAELIKKLEKLTSKYEAEQLQRQVFIYNRIKTDNETIYYNVDMIHDAIYRNRQITFQYAEWNAKKELSLKHGGALYQVSPWALSWDDENYYLIAYDEKADMIKHYRVDKIRHLTLIDQERIGKEHFNSFDLAVFAKKTFGMYGGKDERVMLLCHNSLAGVVIDRFGQNVWMFPYDKEHFKASVDVTVSRQFFGWLTGIGEKMQIMEPESVKEEYLAYLRNVLKEYD
ncbi:MAG: WYL domain-containing protein [Eubacteriales bacterium]|nr:WYL domain-containing protein [Eubacteriales bacterium]